MTFFTFSNLTVQPGSFSGNNSYKLKKILFPTAVLVIIDNSSNLQVFLSFLKCI